MTPRTIENEFSELLQKDLGNDYPLDLSLEAPLFIKTHPKVLLTKLQYSHGQEQEASNQAHGWYFDSFSNISDARIKYPEIKLQFVGYPWAMNKFFESHEETAIIDFKELGAVVLSKNELATGPRHELHHHVLHAWLSYALSPELWGTVGKWTRFHLRLHSLFSGHDLLSGSDSIGYYPLKGEASRLSDFGFQGTNLEKSYVLVLPWTFPLSALNKLEEIVKQEF